MSEERDEFKACSHCKISRPRTEYAKKSDALDGLQSWCRICMKNRPDRRPKREKIQLTINQNISLKNTNRRADENFYYKPLNNNKLDLLIQSVLIYHKFYRN